MTEQVQADYLDKYKGVQAQIHQVSKFYHSGIVSTKHFSKSSKAKKRCHKSSKQFSIIDHSTIVGTLLDGIDCKIP